MGLPAWLVGSTAEVLPERNTSQPNATCVACGAGPSAVMHKALVLICSRALNAAARGPASREQVLRRLLEAPQLLPWYTEGVLRNFRGETVSAAQVGAALCWAEHCHGGVYLMNLALV